jgi:hypothetical protein
LPLPVPAALFVWSGPIRWLIWTAVAIAMVVTVVDRDRRRLAQRFPPLSRWCAAGRAQWPARSPYDLAFAAWQVRGGGEPHYLVITQSLLLDGDLRSRTITRAALPGLLRRTTGAPPSAVARMANYSTTPRCVRARRRHLRLGDTTAPWSCGCSS